MQQSTSNDTQASHWRQSEGVNVHVNVLMLISHLQQTAVTARTSTTACFVSEMAIRSVWDELGGP